MVNIKVSTTTPVAGAVAVFRYPPSAEFPNGTPHYAPVDFVATSTPSFFVDDCNYSRCKCSRREIQNNDRHLLGFYIPG